MICLSKNADPIQILYHRYSNFTIGMAFFASGLRDPTDPCPKG